MSACGGKLSEVIAPGRAVVIPVRGHGLLVFTVVWANNDGVMVARDGHGLYLSHEAAQEGRRRYRETEKQRNGSAR